MELSSVHNPRVKKWSKLLSKKGRDGQNAYLIEGEHLVEEALKSGASLEAIVYNSERGVPEPVLPYLEKDMPVYPSSASVISRLTDTETPQGIVAVVTKSKTDILHKQLEKIISNEAFFLLMLDRIQDPGNLGAIIRTADAAGIDGVILGNGTVDLYNPKTVRSTMGSLFHLPVISGDLQEWIEKIRDRGARIIGTSLQDAKLYTESIFTAKTAVIIGNEGKGISSEILQLTDLNVRIPIYGKAESLNAAVAGAIILYEGARQRGIR